MGDGRQSNGRVSQYHTGESGAGSSADWKLTGCGECWGRQPVLTALPLVCDGQLSKANQSFVIRRFVGATTWVLHTGTIEKSEPPFKTVWTQHTVSSGLQKQGLRVYLWWGLCPLHFLASQEWITDWLFRFLLLFLWCFSVLISSLVYLTTKIQINLFSFLFFAKAFKPCL